MKGIFQQIREANIHNYNNLSDMSLSKFLDELSNTERHKLFLKLDRLYKINSIKTEQFNNIELLLYSDDNYNVNLAKEIIKKL